jgi:hypothetical protein
MPPELGLILLWFSVFEPGGGKPPAGQKKKTKKKKGQAEVGLVKRG